MQRYAQRLCKQAPRALYVEQSPAIRSEDEMKIVAVALTLLGWLVFTNASAHAQCGDQACVRTSTTLASVNTQQSALLDATLNGLLGTGQAVDLTVLDDNALANTSLKLGDLTAALNALGVGSDASTALSASVSLGRVLQAMATTARNQGNTAAATTLDTLQVQTSGVSAGTFKLGDLITADTRSGPLASSQINVLDLLSGSASLFNTKNVASINELSLLGPQLGLGPSIANVQIGLVVVEPAVFVCGPQGTKFYSANIRLRVRVNLTGSGVDLTIPLLTSVHLNLVSLDLVVVVGRASGTIQAINAALGTLTVNATPGIAELYLGTISDANFLDRTTPIDPATELSGAIIGSLAIKLLVVSVSAAITAQAYALGTTPSAKQLNFTGPYPQTLTATTQASFAGSLVSTLLSNLKIAIDLDALGVLGDVLSSVLNGLLSAVSGVLTSTGGLLAPLLNSLTGSVVDPLLSALGIKLGEVAVTAERPFKVAAGTTCNDGAFCTVTDVCNGTGTCAGVARSCADTLSCTVDACDEVNDVCTNILAGACLIDGQCVASATSDPTNSCRACVPASSTTAWTNKPASTSCDDHLFCTSGDTCNGAGACIGLPLSCNDGLPCTVDSCSEGLASCVSVVAAGCSIGGACIPSGADDPANPCRTCNPVLSTNSYSNKPTAAACDDGLFCTVGDACNGNGVCASAARNCEDGISCTVNACNENADVCTSTVNGSCLINGACVAAGSDEPGNPCRTCNPAVTTSAYSNKASGVACDDGRYCTTTDVCNGSGACVGVTRVCNPGGGCASVCNEAQQACVTSSQGCLIGGACIAPGTTDPSNPCRSCVPTVSSSAWTNQASGTACNDGLFCTTGDACNGSGGCVGSARDCTDNLACTSDSCDEVNDRCGSALNGGCLIGGACIAAGTDDPTNPCRACIPTSSTAAYSNKPGGTVCDDHRFCTTSDVCNAGLCNGAARVCDPSGHGCASSCDESTSSCRTDVAGCLIGSACVTPGSDDPSNPCHTCNPAVSTTAWTNKAAATVCDDGQFCTTGDACNGAGVCAGTARVCDATGQGCSSACDESADVCKVAVQGCLIGGACIPPGTDDPSNPCRACIPASSTVAYSNKTSGTVCSDGLFCTIGDVCNGSGTCAGRARDCGDGLTCTDDSCDETLDRCSSSINTGCLIAGACVPSGANDPSNTCRSCNPLLSSTNYSNKAAGASCADGLFCTVGDACDGQGGCASSARSCDDGITCTLDACDEASDRCTSSVGGGCLIDGVCRPAASDDPNNACRACNPDVSLTSWSNKLSGVTCSDGLFCTTGDVCNGSGACQGTPRVCDASGQGCSSVCDESQARCVTGMVGCLIAGACVAPGSDDPTNGCRSCVPSTSTTTWTNKSSGITCNDALFCTINDVCNGSGTCVGTPRDCSDSNDCTNDACDEAADHCTAQLSGGCLIDNACIAAGAADPRSPCRTCVPSKSTTSWSNRAAGTSCDDGLFCTTGDLCDGEGACTGSARDCNGGASGCASACDESADVCRSDVASCVIDGACRAAGTADPHNPCRECNPELAPAAWSNKTAGSSCDDGLYCTDDDRCDDSGACTGTLRSCGGGTGNCASFCDENADACNAGLTGCNIDGVCRAAGTDDPANPCQTCNPQLSTSAWSLKAAGTACSDGLFCTTGDVCSAQGRCTGSALSCSDNHDCTRDFCDETADRCSSTIQNGCLINDACQPAGATSPGNPCRSCNPLISTSAWSNLPAATSCDDGLFCTVSDGCDGQGTCAGSARSCSGGSGCSSFCDEQADRCRSDVLGCAIGTTCVAAGSEDPSSSCRSCDPTLSMTAYSPKPVGSACDDGLFCTRGDACGGDGACVGTATSCDDNQSCTLDSCDERSGSCAHASSKSCVIGGACVAAGAAAPGLPCRVCDPLQSTTHWSNAPSNVQCDDGSFCTPQDHCDGAGACVGEGERCPSDGLACTREVCDEASDSCRVGVSSGCAVANQCWGSGVAAAYDPCFVCDPARSATGFSYEPKRAGCDSDQDGLLDGFEQNDDGSFLDSDGDGTPNHLDADDDNDTVLTRNEYADANGDGSPSDARDLDGDARPDYLDPDDDGDARNTATEVSDPEEYGYTDDVDMDGIANWYDTDTDGDGATDAVENIDGGDSDKDGIPDYLQKDTTPADDDHDGIPTSTECHGNVASCPDSDGDGIPDYLDPDDDGDGIPTRDETGDGNGNGVPDYLESDADGGVADSGAPIATDAAADSAQDASVTVPSEPDRSRGGLAGGALCSAATRRGAPDWIASTVLLSAGGLLLRRRRARRAA